MSWVEAEFESIEIGDHRLDCRSIEIVEGMGLAPGRTIPQIFQSWSEIKATYNFFSNKKVTDYKLLKPHFEKTEERIQEYPVILLASDTTEIDYNSKEAMKGKIRISNKKKGLWLHSTIAITPDRLNLGSLEANFWFREEKVSDVSGTVRDNLPIEEKESFRWLQSYQLACQVSRNSPDTQIINITDREGDIIEVFAEQEKQKKQGSCGDFIIRSQHDRSISVEDEFGKKIKDKLRNKLKKSTSIGEIEFSIPATKKRKGRVVKQELKALKVTLNSKKTKFMGKLRVNAVMAIETTPPEGEDPLIWIFITSLPINTFDEVCKVIKYYLCRWEIELFFKVLKSGCKIEERQLRATDRIKPLIAVFIVLSWRVMFTMMLGRVNSDLACSDLFEDCEWKSVYKVLNKNKRIPRKAPSIKQFIEMIAVLGGYVKSKSGDPPGVKVMWKGMSRMVDFSIGWEAFGG